jgi:drug/metabolite transporter (DMT)-like permease
LTLELSWKGGARVTTTCSCVGAPSPVVLSAVKAIIAAVALALLAFAFPQPAADSFVEGETPTKVEVLPMSYSLRLALASMELGLYGALGSILQVWGLSTVSATAGAFLIQTTTVITPVLAFFAGDTISRRTGAAVALSAIGTLFVTLEDNAIFPVTESGIGALAVEGEWLGKLAVLGAAASYSMATFRLSQLSLGRSTGAACVSAIINYRRSRLSLNSGYLPGHDNCAQLCEMNACLSCLPPPRDNDCSGFRSIDLAAGKNAARMVITVGAAVPEVAFRMQSHDINSVSLASLWPSYGDASAVLLILYVALGPGALSAYLQTYGQRSISASAAQVRILL